MSESIEDPKADEPTTIPETGIAVIIPTALEPTAVDYLITDVTRTTLFDADKGDQLNQLRVIGYKFFQGYLIPWTLCCGDRGDGRDDSGNASRR
jgi:hypothetical protein